MANHDEILMDNAENETHRYAAGPAEQKDAGHDRMMAWWREARVGLFIHWGLYSELAGYWKGEEVKGAYGEHIMLRAQIPVREYEEVAGRFNPVRFSAEEWVKTAKDAGLKYLVFTAKHHDGFAMYDSKVSSFNIVERTPFGRDPVAELAEACAKHGIRLCLYYSHSMDWHHPDSQGNTWDYPHNIGAYDEVESWIGDEDKRTRYERYLERHAIPQVRELLTQYGPIGIVWFDCGHKLTEEQGIRFVNAVKNEQPHCLVNRRVWKDPLGDYGNSGDNQPHVRVPRSDWESIATLNDSWGYKANDHNWKSAQTVMRQLIDTVSMNGNFLINVGPTGTGEFDPTSLKLLGEIGEWMKVNGEAIYGAVKSPIGKPPWGRCTAKGNKLYLHIYEAPTSGNLIVPGLRSAVKAVYLLADPHRTPLKHERLNEEDVQITLPAGLAQQYEIAAVFVVETEETIEANSAKRLYERDYPNVFAAFDGDLHGMAIRYDTGKKGRDYVTGWSAPADFVTWPFRAASAGDYQVQIAYSADAAWAGGAFRVVVAAANPALGAASAADADFSAVRTGDAPVIALSAAVEPTGGPYEPRTFDLGSVHIPAPGRYILAVKAERIPSGALMNLKNVTLTHVG
ncbi:alpha-L-fucosidase [Paenibacillus hamazuiensis]|uniref:alpha-L-fucosidase n=1 Tax=Paenibacillus hamazuiensis TaxID=2936508 RepID=UPI00200E7596|nr:alpha-L-fucosidase [Paenibacillus hamazuiensis]